MFDLDPSLIERYEAMGYIYDLYDGDTVFYHAKLGYNHWACFQAGRLLDINTPEIRPLTTRAIATASRNHLDGLITMYALNREIPASLTMGRKLLCRSEKAPVKSFSEEFVAAKGKYGRWLVELIGADENGKPISLNRLMVEHGFAKDYS